MDASICAVITCWRMICNPFPRIFQTYERTSCHFVGVGKPKAVDELLPTGISVSKTGTVNLRVQTPVFVGNITFGSSVGLSPHLGRVYLNETR